MPVPLTAAHRRFLVLEQGLGAALVNLVLNAGIAWANGGDLAIVPMWGERGMAADTLATGFLLPFLTTLIATRLVRRDLRRGRVAPLPARPGILASLPERLFLRALVLGGLGVVLLGVPGTLILAALAVQQVSPTDWILIKGGIAAAMAAIATPVIALRALFEQSR